MIKNLYRRLCYYDSFVMYWLGQTNLHLPEFPPLSVSWGVGFKGGKEAAATCFIYCEVGVFILLVQLLSVGQLWGLQLLLLPGSSYSFCETYARCAFNSMMRCLVLLQDTVPLHACGFQLVLILPDLPSLSSFRLPCRLQITAWDLKKQFNRSPQLHTVKSL